MLFELAECQRVIGYHFANSKLLEVALTHSSLRAPDRECNERLEFLGDSVLGLVVTEELYRLLPDQAEGELTRLKSAIVSRGALYLASQRLGLARFADFARGVSRREELPVSVTANLVEAVIGAIYLDAGFFPAREFVLRHLGEELDATLSDRGAKNFKSLLQHAVQDAMGFTPTYRTMEEGGPDHKKQFVVAAMIRGQEWGRAEGGTKKEAEQEAAEHALEAFQRRGRGRRRRRGGRDDEGLAGAREVGEHVDEAAPYGDDASALGGFSEGGLCPDAEAGADLPPPEFDEVRPTLRRALAPEQDAYALEGAPMDGGVVPGETLLREKASPSDAVAPRAAPSLRAPVPARSAPPRSAVPEAAPRAVARPAEPPAAVPARRAPSRPPAAPSVPAACVGFAEGLDVPAAPPSAPVPASRTAKQVGGSVAARKKAPATWAPPPPEEGFGSGL